MIDDLLHGAQQEYLRGRDYYRAGAMPRALLAYHAALEQLLRFSLIRDGADYERATDPGQINWQTLITYLDVRYALPREQCVFLSQMTHLRDQVLAGSNPELSPMVMQGYDKLVTQIFRRLYPRDETARNDVMKLFSAAEVTAARFPMRSEFPKLKRRARAVLCAELWSSAVDRHSYTEPSNL